MKLVKNYDNNEFKKSLEGSKEVYDDILNNTVSSYSMADEQYEFFKKTLEKVSELSQMDKDVLYLYAQFGATDTAEILGISRTYVYKLINSIKEKIKVE